MTRKLFYCKITVFRDADTINEIKAVYNEIMANIENALKNPALGRKGN